MSRDTLVLAILTSLGAIGGIGKWITVSIRRSLEAVVKDVIKEEVTPQMNRVSTELADLRKENAEDHARVWAAITELKEKQSGHEDH